jgi:hypothetical protein
MKHSAFSHHTSAPKPRVSNPPTPHNPQLKSQRLSNRYHTQITSQPSPYQHVLSAKIIRRARQARVRNATPNTSRGIACASNTAHAAKQVRVKLRSARLAMLGRTWLCEGCLGSRNALLFKCRRFPILRFLLHLLNIAAVRYLSIFSNSILLGRSHLFL